MQKSCVFPQQLLGAGIKHPLQYRADVPKGNFSNSNFIKKSYLEFLCILLYLSTLKFWFWPILVYEVLANPFEINYISSRTLGFSVTLNLYFFRKKNPSFAMTEAKFFRIHCIAMGTNEFLASYHGQTNSDEIGTSPNLCPFFKYTSKQICSECSKDWEGP